MEKELVLKSGIQSLWHAEKWYIRPILSIAYCALSERLTSFVKEIGLDFQSRDLKYP